MQPQHCNFCCHYVQPNHVHGHYQCPVCINNAWLCCDGDNCYTNWQINAAEKPTIHPLSKEKHENLRTKN